MSDYYEIQIGDLKDQIEYLESQNKRYREALEYYNKEPFRTANGTCFDTGKVAREALKESENKDSE